MNKDYRKIGHLLKPYKGRLCGIIVLNIFSVFFSIFSITMLAPFLSLIFNPKNILTEAPALHFSSESLINELQYLMGQIVLHKGSGFALVCVILFIFSLFLLKNIFAYLSMMCTIPMRTSILKDLRDRCFHRLLIAPLSFYAQSQKGDTMSRVINDIQEVDNAILQYVQQLFKEILTFLLFFAMLLFIHWKFTLFILFSLPIAAGIISLVQKSLKHHSTTAKQAEGNMLSLTEESIYGLRVIKAFNNIADRNAHFQKKNQEYNKLITKINRLRDLSSPLSDFIGMCLVVILLIAGSFLISSSHGFSAEVFITYLVLFTQIINPVKVIADATASFKKGFASLQRIDELLQTDEKIIEKPDALPIQELKTGISFCNVDFAYKEKKILKQLSFDIPRGKNIAICGSSGSGKSTIANLLPRFYDICSGSILIDGIDLRDLKINELRDLFSIVSQESILFNDTLFNNIAFGQPESTEKDVWNAVEAAQLGTFVRSLKKGLQTEVGDRGLKLSGGQQQRINIARAFLKNAPVLILDEATSALDTESERQVQQAISQLMKGKTTLSIAHRLSTIADADEILVLDEGEIKERGTHQELMQRNGIYSQMVHLQGFNKA